MGSGKSTLGKRLSAALGCDFFDLDGIIEKEEGLAIPEIFAQKGESYFRKIEARQLRDTQLLSRAVIATGGGTPCFSQNMEWMNGEGVTLFLDVPAAVILNRLKEEKTQRPLLAGKSDEELEPYINKLLLERIPFYGTASFSCRADFPIDELTVKLTDYFCRFIR